MSQTLSRRQDVTRQVSGAPYLSRTNLQLGQVHPSQGAKYSPNLFEYLNARAGKASLQLQRLFLDGQGTQWLGYFDDVGHFVGARLSQILSYGKKTQATCPINLGDMREVEGFWDAYRAQGRCAIDPEHKTSFLDDRWKLNAEGTERSCQWCQKASQRLVRQEVLVTRTGWV